MANNIMDEQHEELEMRTAAGTDLPSASLEPPRDDESHVQTQPLPQRNPLWPNFWVLLALLCGVFAVWLVS